MDRRGCIRLPEQTEGRATSLFSILPNHPMGRPALFLPRLPSPSLGPDVPGKSYLSAFQLSFSMWFSGPSLSKEAMKRAEGWRAPESQHPHRWAIKR